MLVDCISAGVRCLLGRLRIWLVMDRFLMGATTEMLIIMARYFSMSERSCIVTVMASVIL